MKIHEYQAKELFKDYGIPVPKGKVAFSVVEANEIIKDLTGRIVVKAQIHAGGRGKGGGIKLANDRDGVPKLVDEILGMTLITPQTGPDGRLVKKVLIEEAVEIEQELYLGILVDRATSSPVIMASSAGGMEIEEIAEKDPESIIKVIIGNNEVFPFHIRKLIYGLDIDLSIQMEFVSLIKNLFALFIREDCSLLEINPLVITKDKRIIALDAKIALDDNAMFRHERHLELRDISEEDGLEIEASRFKLNYIKLNGNIGCMVNGAGLAMATMDIIKLSGAEPANFLDVGGGANVEMIKNAFRILISDKNVEAVLINIFGGILRCDILAQGLVDATKDIDITLPVIVRLEGTNVEKGNSILTEAKLNFIVAKGMKDAAQKVANIIKINHEYIS